MWLDNFINYSSKFKNKFKKTTHIIKLFHTNLELVIVSKKTDQFVNSYVR